MYRSPAEGQLEFKRRKNENKNIIDLIRVTLPLSIYNEVTNLIISYAEKSWHEYICGQPLGQNVCLEIAGVTLDKYSGEWLDELEKHTRQNTSCTKLHT